MGIQNFYIKITFPKSPDSSPSFNSSPFVKPKLKTNSIHIRPKHFGFQQTEDVRSKLLQQPFCSSKKAPRCCSLIVPCDNLHGKRKQKQRNKQPQKENKQKETNRAKNKRGTKANQTHTTRGSSKLHVDRTRTSLSRYYLIANQFRSPTEESGWSP